MRSFKDNKEREWNISVNVASIKRVRDECELDLLKIVEGTLIDKLMTDPVLLVDVLFVLCRPQVKELDITDEDFGEAMAGDAIEHAVIAFLDALVDFCPSPRDREHLGQVVKTTQEVMEKARDLTEQEIKNGALDRIADKALASIQKDVGALSIPVPESSDSTQTHSPSEN